MEKSPRCNDYYFEHAFRDSSRDLFITNTAKLPIDVVKKLIASVARRPNIWARSNNGRKRCDQNLMWHEISEEVHLPVDICRTKWGHLRDNFRKVFIRNTLSDEMPTTWRFYNDMRFMEKSVADNIVRQNRLRTHERAGHKLSQFRHLGAVLPPLGGELNNVGTDFPYNFDVEPSSHSSLENSLFCADTYVNELPLFKKIKLEPQRDTESDQRRTVATNCTNNGDNRKDYDLTKYDYLHDDGVTSYTKHSDPFDGSDCTANKCIGYQEQQQQQQQQQQQKSNVKVSKGQVFTIEVFDNDDMHDAYQSERNSGHKKESNGTKKPHDETTTPYVQGYTSDMLSTERGVNVNAGDHTDTDRLFLLSLLPYLQKVPLHRKLHVRQNLQNVLIEEFG